MKSTSRLLSILFSLVLAGTPVHAETAPPNILIVLTDDVGLLNIGACHRGLMSSRTPNIDRIAKEGDAVHRLLCSTNLYGG